jgi:hypothetical protein
MNFSLQTFDGIGLFSGFANSFKGGVALSPTGLDQFGVELKILAFLGH